MAAQAGMIINDPEHQRVNPTAFIEQDTQRTVMKIQMPQSIDILALIAADLPGLDAMLGGPGAGTVNRSTARAPDLALISHEADYGGIGRRGAKGRFLFDEHYQVVGVQLVAPVRMLTILGRQQFTHLRTQSGVPALVRADFSAQRLHRILLLVPSGMKPPLDR